MVNFIEYVKSDKSLYSSEGRRRILEIIKKAAEGEIWLEVGWIDIEGKRIRHHSWGQVRLGRFIEQLKKMDDRVRDRITDNGSLHFFINERVKNKIIKRNLWGAKENREKYFGKEEDEGEVVRLYLPFMYLTTPWTLKKLIEKLEELQNLKI